MTTGKLVGHDDATGEGPSAAGLLRMSKFTATATGNITEFRVKCGAAGNIKAAVYDDSGGEPNNLLGSIGSTAVAVGWNTLAFPSTPIVAGSDYWLAYLCNTNSVYYVTETGNYRYQAWTYTNAFPNPAGSGYTPSTLWQHIFAGWGALVLSPTSISQPVSYGSPKLNLTIKPSSILQALAFGTPTVLTSALIIQPSSIVQGVAIGMPVLRYPQILLPSSIVQPVVVGTPWIGIFGFVRPQSIVQQISIGSPTILKYVWHVILDGQYATETPEVNRAYIIGRDQYGNPVYGTAVNTDEVVLVGERLDFQPDPAIPTTAQAGDVASAVLSKMRLSGKRGVILIPPNCGQELFDVVQTSDAGANQSAVKFRVVGIRFEYNPKQTRYQHKLILGAP